MSRYARSHLSDQSLLQNAATNAGQERTFTADLLADVAEIDARRLYLPAGYPSLFAYCVGELHLSEDGAARRIQAARVARRFPALFEAVAHGRLHLTAVGLLAPHLTEDTADELLAAATHQSKAGIERLLAERYPRPDVLAWVESLPASPGPGSAGQHALAHVEDGLAPDRAGEACEHALAHVGDRSRVKPLSAQSFAVQFTLSRRGHEKLRYAQELLGHQIPSGDIAAVFERALGFSAAEARRAAERCADIPDASLEERMRVALSCFGMRSRQQHHALPLSSDLSQSLPPREDRDADLHGERVGREILHAERARLVLVADAEVDGRR